MNKEIRKTLCKNCLKKVRNLEAKYLKKYREKKRKFFKCPCGSIGNWQGNQGVCGVCQAKVVR